MPALAGSSSLLSTLIYGFLLLLVLGPLAFALWGQLRRLGLVWQLRRHGVRAAGCITGRRQDGAATTYQVRFAPHPGLVVEAPSRGRHLLDPGYRDAAQVPLRYDARHPERFMLESELAPGNLLGLGGLLLAALGLLGYAFYWPRR